MKKGQKGFTKFVSVLLSVLMVVSAVVVPVQAETSNDEWDNISAEDKNAVHTSGTSEVYDSHELDTTEIVSNGNCGANGDNVKYELHKNGTLYIYGEGKMTGYSYYLYSSVINVVIEPGVTSIGDSTFHYCSSLTSIEIPNSVTSIGDGTFSDCSRLTSIEIPSSVTSIGDYTFWYCSSLTSIEIPNSVTSIGDSTFYYCSSLTSIEIPNSVTSIGDSAFGWCSSLTSIEIPNSVTSIGNSAFYNCSSLKDVYYTGTEEQWKKLTIGNNNGELTSAAIHYPKPHDTDTDTDDPKEPDKPTPTKPNKLGDIDGDGQITAADSLLILRRSVSLEKLTKEQEKLADVDGDGSITSADSLEVLRASVGLKGKWSIGEPI